MSETTIMNSNRNNSSKNSSNTTNDDDSDKKPAAAQNAEDSDKLEATSVSPGVVEDIETRTTSIQASRTNHSFSGIASQDDENTTDMSHRTSLPAENPPRYDPNFDPSEASVTSTGSKGTKAKKKTQRTKRPRQPPMGDVTIPISSRQSSVSTLSNSIQQVVQRPSRRNSLSNSQRSHGYDSSSSVASNISTSSRRIGLMGRLLAEMQMIERECFDDDQEHNDADDADDHDDDENMEDDRW